MKKIAIIGDYNQNEESHCLIMESNSICKEEGGACTRYVCRFSAYRSVFQNSDVITAIVETKNGHFRGFELKEHPFFIGTLFIPQLDFKGDSSYRIIKSFVKAVLDREETYE